jgi:hypothetical protein
MPVDFFNDLGIIPNKGTENENNNNLLQGQKYKNYTRTYLEIAKPHLVILEQTYVPNANNTNLYNTNLYNTKMNNTKMNNTKMNDPSKKKQVHFKGIMNPYKKTMMDALNKKKLTLLRQKKIMNKLSSPSPSPSLSSFVSHSDNYLYIFLMAFFCILLFLILKYFVSIISCNHVLLVFVLIIVVFIFTTPSIHLKKGINAMIR